MTLKKDITSALTVSFLPLQQEQPLVFGLVLVHP
jgi:hypothetical protein